MVWARFSLGPGPNTVGWVFAVAPLACPTTARRGPHEIYWWTGRDGRRLLLKWNSLHGNASLGGYAEASDPVGIVEYLDHDAGYQARWKYPLVKAAFGKGHDNIKTLTAEFESAARDKSTANRHMRNSNEIDFFPGLRGNLWSEATVLLGRFRQRVGSLPGFAGGGLSPCETRNESCEPLKR